MKYQLEYNPTPRYRIVLRTVLLIGGVITDIGALFTVFFSFLVGNFGGALYALPFIGAGILVRLVANRLVYTLKYTVCGNTFKIEKVYPARCKPVLEVEIPVPPELSAQLYPKHIDDYMFARISQNTQNITDGGCGSSAGITTNAISNNTTSNTTANTAK